MRAISFAVNFLVAKKVYFHGWIVQFYISLREWHPLMRPYDEPFYCLSIAPPANIRRAGHSPFTDIVDARRGRRFVCRQRKHCCMSGVPRHRVSRAQPLIVASGWSARVLVKHSCWRGKTSIKKGGSLKMLVFKGCYSISGNGSVRWSS